MYATGQASQSPDPGGHTEPRPSTARQYVACFEYTGRTGMTVRGPATGRRYRFDYPGARVFVDLRDRAALAAVPHLRQVRSP
jgi:hypothetical protein